jgi:hypothetical protein
MVERNPGVVRCASWDRSKRVGGTRRDLIDRGALCDENVARGPRRHGIGGLGWSDGYVFFQARTHGAGNRRQERDIPQAVDRIDVLAAVFAHEQFSPRSEHA